ncbi:MAG TPA: rRNA maturation RNase YbeY [Vicinamibacterales bacterium]|nr:rRNA maturation RNase YbeY [Vicinamibacterales bacterium]
MPSRTPRRRSAGGARLVVTLTAPDGASLPARGLAIWLANAAPANARGEVTVALISDARMRTLNRAYRNRDYATDVLSFPAVAKAMAGKPAVAKASTSAKASAVAKASADKSAGRSVDKMAGMPASADQKAGGAGKADGAEALYLGDIVIATGVAQRQADDVGHPVGTEIKVLALHGLLHLLGYDHETDTGKMARLEARLRKKAGLEDGLIARRSR